MSEKKNSTQKPARKLILVRSTGRWEDNINMDLKKQVCRCGLHSSASRHGTATGSCGHGSSPLLSRKGRNCIILKYK
jgi:hypothetical protein